MSLIAFGLTLLMGGVVGLVSGLLGVGGGIVMVPFLYLLFSHPGWSGITFSADYHAVVAHATSLLVIVPTALATLLSRHRYRFVEGRIYFVMGILAVLAALGGVQLAERLSSDLLKAGFGLFLFLSGLTFLFASRGNGGEPVERAPARALAMASGLLVGAITALFGAGGGSVATPSLIHLTRLDTKKVAATSLAVVAMAASAAVLGYAVVGWDNPQLPPWTLGYIYLPAGLTLLPGALLGAPLGVRLSEHVSPRRAKVLFGLVFLLIGLRIFLGRVMEVLG